MKYTSILRILVPLVTVVAIGYGCEEPVKEKEPVLTTPVVSHVTVSDISKFTANVSAEFTNGGHKITERGFCYDSEGDPTIESDKMIIEEDVKTLAVMLRELNAITTYYVKAYIKAEDGNVYYSPWAATFTTEFFQTPVAAINSVNASGKYIDIQAFVVSDESDPITARGIVVSPTADRTDAEAKTILAETNSSGVFDLSATELEQETQYYVWAFVETAGAGRIFSELYVATSTVASIYIAGVTKPGSFDLIACHHAILDMAITDTGAPGATISEAGILWSSDEATELVLEGAGVNKRTDRRITALNTVYDVTAAPLLKGTTYYFRPYMKNSAGTVIYGTAKSFTTREDTVFGDNVSTPEADGNYLNFVSTNNFRNLGQFSASGTSYMTDFQMNSYVGTKTLDAAMKLDNFSFNNGADPFEEIAYLIFGINKAKDSTVVYQFDFNKVPHVSTTTYDLRSRFGAKVTLNAATSVLTFSNLGYSGTDNFSTISNQEHRFAAELLMSSPNAGPAMTKHITWLLGTATEPRRVLLDWYGYTSATSNSGCFIVMPLDESVNPDLGYFRLGRARWSGPVMPEWPATE